MRGHFDSIPDGAVIRRPFVFEGAQGDVMFTPIPGNFCDVRVLRPKRLDNLSLGECQNNAIRGRVKNAKGTAHWRGLFLRRARLALILVTGRSGRIAP